MENIPSHSKIRLYTDGADFMDCFLSRVSYSNQSALDLFLIIARETPTWVNRLMSLRNQIVSKLGLKNLGQLADIEANKVGSDYQVGDRVGIFTLHTHSHHEVILEDQDKHLGVKISFYVEPEEGDMAKIYASTVVHENNLLGKVYMFFVAPIHKKIVPATLKTLEKHT